MTNEETKYMPNAVQNENTIPSPQPRRGVKTGWKRVAIGGVAGIMVGTAAAYAATHLMGNHDTEQPTDDNADTAEQAADHKMAQNVSDDMTFGDAFAAARDEVGAGGVFTWRGNVYGTFTADEWNAMTSQEQMDYFAAISGQEVPQHEPVAAAQPAVQEVHHYHHVVDDTPVQATAQTTETAQSDQYISSDDSHSFNEEGVRVVGDVQSITNDDGTVTHVVPIETGGHAGILMGEDAPEVAIIDINDNRQLDADDVIIDLQTGESATMAEVHASIEQEGYTNAGEEVVIVESTPDPNGREVGYTDSPADEFPEVEATVYGPPTDPINDPALDPAMDPGMEPMAETGMVDDVPIIDC